jgi:DNA-binding MarR family transcriptional regulator
MSNQPNDLFNDKGNGNDLLFDLERFLAYRLVVLSDRISRSLAEVYQGRFGISIPEWRIIAQLIRYAPLSAREVGERTNMDKPRVSRALARLTERGLVEREQDSLDRRVAVLNLSAKGRALYREIEPLAMEWQKQLLATSGLGDGAELQAMLDQLADGIEQISLE